MARNYTQIRMFLLFGVLLRHPVYPHTKHIYK